VSGEVSPSKRDSRSWWAILIAGLGIFGLSIHSQAPAPRDESKTASAERSVIVPPKNRSKERVLRPLTDFLSTTLQPKKVPTNKWSDSDKWELTTMIVCVPNPIQSAVGYYFDPLIESVQQAMSADGFVLDRYYFPWFTYRQLLALDPKLQFDRDIRDFRYEPGSMLFRDRGIKKRLVFMLLVGDSPLSGIAKPTFTEAVHIIRNDIPLEKQRLPLKYCPPKVLPVLGPVYTGSADSLALAIKAASSSGKLSFHVVSGSALNVDKSEFEQRSGYSACFHSTLARSDLLKFELIRYVYEHQLRTPEPLEIAWLTESNTGFGQVQQLGQLKPEKDEKGPAPLRIQEMARFTSYPFPMHISRVRGIFSAAMESEKKDFPDPFAARTQIKIPFEDEEPARDVLPEMSPMMTSSSVELVLNEIMSTIARRRFAYVGITTTDIRDAIFLGGLVRKHSPDAQLLILVPDILFMHPQSRPSLQGALIASSYPMMDTGGHRPPGNQSEGIDEVRKVHFASDWGQGVYNAAIILQHPELDANDLNAPPPKTLPENDPLNGFISFWPAPDCKDKDCQRVLLRRQPAIWLSVLGNENLWPLECRSIYDSATELFKIHDKPHKHLCPDCRRGESSESDKKRDEEFKEMVGYTFSTWPSPEPSTKQADDKGYIARFAICTHLDAFNRTIFFVVLLLAVHEVLQRRKIWSTIRPELRSGSYFVAVITAMGCLLSVSIFISWLTAIHLADVVSQEADIWSHWPWFMGGLALFVVGGELIAVWFVTGLEQNRRVPGRLYLFAAVAAVVLTFAGIYFGPREFLAELDGVVLVLASLVSTGIVQMSIRYLGMPKVNPGILTVVLVPLALIPLGTVTFFALVPSADGWLFTRLFFDRLFFNRAAHATSGVSAWASWLLLATGLYVFSYARGAGVKLCERLMAMRCPWPRGLSNPSLNKLVESLQSGHREICENVREPYKLLWNRHRPTSIVLMGGVLLWLMPLRTKLAPLMYDGPPALGFWFLLSAFFIVWVYRLYSTVTLLKTMENLFGTISRLPIGSSFGRLPQPLSHLFGRQSVIFRVREIHFEDLQFPQKYLQSLESIAKSRSPLRNTLKAQRKFWDWNSLYDSQGLVRKSSDHSIKGRKYLNKVARAIWKEVAADRWAQRDAYHTFEFETRPARRQKRDSSVEAVAQGDEETDADKLADDFIAIQLALYCGPLLRYAWLAYWLLALSAILFLLAVAAYAAQPQGFFGTTAVAMIVTLGVFTALIMWRLEQNRLLSHLSGTTPGKVDFDAAFLVQAVLLLLVPLVVLINYAFPGSFDWAEYLLAPVFRVVK
jgi:hypothetical protein